ncbi:MAG TPA: hypothetical protein VFQ44_16535 [Streptosporangiaceae bacterium]|nr:hypothetical protein [Streptosporangiaceae bacterium]
MLSASPAALLTASLAPPRTFSQQPGGPPDPGKSAAVRAATVSMATVPTNYDQIRAENIARYGWDTAVLTLLGQLYGDRTHFIFELIQNAEDAGATELIFELFDDRLEVRHDGRPFTEADVRGICGVGQGTKAQDLTKIGRFGIGFKSVYAYTNTPVIASGDERFRIEKYVRPHAEPPHAEPPHAEPSHAGAAGSGETGSGAAGSGETGPGTVFVFPFDRPEVPASVAVAEISAALGNIDAEVLLFLSSIGRLTVLGRPVPPAVLRRTSASGISGSRRVALSTERAGRRSDAAWLVWSSDLGDLGNLGDLGVPGLRVDIAFSEVSEFAGTQRPSRGTTPLIVYFPTEKETFLGFFISGPYRTTPARDNVPGDDPWNAALVRRTAGLLTKVLAGLRDGGLLTARVLAALPLEEARFAPGTMFRPLFEAVLTAFREGELVPDAGGGYRGPAGVVLADSPEVRALLSPEQLGELYGGPGPVAFAHESLTEAGWPLLWQYLRDQVGIAVATPGAIVERLTGEFLAAQPDEWIARLYAFAGRHPSLWRSAGTDGGPAWSKPIIRLQDGSQVLPFTPEGRPAAYLPGSPLAFGATGFPTVAREVAGDPDARRFLESLGFAEPDVLAQVRDHVLPRYAGDADVSQLDAGEHEADVQLVALALDEAPPAARGPLLDRLARTAFLIGENAATGEHRLMRPGQLYLRTKALEIYFDGNPEAWFAADTYGPWAAQLRGMGVHQEVRPAARAADELGHVIIVRDFGRNERGVAGFDPEASVDGLRFAVEHPSPERSEFIWNAVLLPNRHLLAGVVERSPRLDFSGARRERTQSEIGELTTSAAWLPAPDGGFRRPDELQLDELPPSFGRDASLASALAMSQPSIDEASRQLGLPPGFLQRLSRHPDLVAQIERELGSRESGRREPPPALL